MKIHWTFNKICSSFLHHIEYRGITQKEKIKNRERRQCTVRIRSEEEDISVRWQRKKTTLDQSEIDSSEREKSPVHWYHITECSCIDYRPLITLVQSPLYRD